jgi:hypothetical protein
MIWSILAERQDESVARAKHLDADLLPGVIHIGTSQALLVRLADQQDLLVRTRGPRDWSQLPQQELREVMRRLESVGHFTDRASLYRATRRVYGYSNLGSDARRLLEDLDTAQTIGRE